MSIGKRVSETFVKLIGGDPEAAMYQICSAIDATAQRESGRDGKSVYKAFLTANTDIICGVGFGVMLAGIRIKYSHPKVDSDTAGTCSFEDIIYHAVRCGLYHEATLPGTILFTKNRIGPDAQGCLQLPEMFIAGLAFAVVVSPVNANERSDPGHFIAVKGTQFHVNDWWGRSADFRTALQAVLAKSSTGAATP
jgi:hypothetical protein